MQGNQILSRALPALVSIVIAGGTPVLSGCGGPRGDSTEDAILAGELQGHVEWLASDALGGRRSGTPQGDRAARYLANEFERYGLRPMGDDGTFLQAFSFVAGVELGRDNRFDVATSTEPYRIDRDWRPLAFSDNGGGTIEVVFAGYGISEPGEGYDDYAGADVAGKAVMVLPYGPPESEGGMRFPLQHELRRKAAAARDRGAAAILFVPHPAHDPADYLEPLRLETTPSAAGILALSITKETADALLGNGNTIETLQQQIDDQGTPIGAPAGATIELRIDVRKIEAAGYNVVGGLVSERIDAPWVVIGAHYDHLGKGGEGSLAPDSVVVHNGADDNASGTAGLLELAQAFATRQPTGENLLFAAFAAEEIGLLGSAYLASNLPPEVAAIEAMVNMDMIGRLNEADELSIYGTGTGDAWDGLIDVINAGEDFGFTISRIPDGYGASDHSSFYAKQIPVLHFFTGTHGDYHRPSDDPATLNYAGEERVVRFIHEIVLRLDRRREVVAYQVVARPQTEGGGRAGLGVYTGVIPDFAWQGEGFRLTGVTDGSPAAMAGIEAGDIILRMGNRTIRDIYDYTYALREGSPGKRVEMELKRGERTFTVQIVLGNRRTR
jgi:hypothetical protein